MKMCLNGIRFDLGYVMGFEHVYNPDPEKSYVCLHMVSGSEIHIHPTDEMGSPKVLEILDHAFSKHR